MLEYSISLKKNGTVHINTLFFSNGMTVKVDYRNNKKQCGLNFLFFKRLPIFVWNSLSL